MGWSSTGFRLPKLSLLKKFLWQEKIINYENFFQLGHDGLAAEAGFPPDDNVEVYDAWYGLPQVCTECWIL